MTMQADLPPADFTLSCDLCGDKPGKNAGPNWVKNHKRSKHGIQADAPMEDQISQLPSNELTAAEKKLAKEIQASIAMPTMLLFAVNATDAQIVMMGTPELVTALILVARKSKQLKTFLIFVAEGTIWLGLAAAVMAIVGPILDNHGVISIPTLKVSDKIGGAAGSSRPSTGPQPSAPSHNPQSGNPFSDNVATTNGNVPTGAMPDVVAGMNRAARRAVEADPGPMPPDISKLLDAYGVTEADIMEAARSLPGMFGSG